MYIFIYTNSMKRLPTKQFQKLVPKLRKKGFYGHKELRPIFWSEYTLAQIEEAKETLCFIRNAVDECKQLNSKGRVGRPLTDPKDLAKAILISEFLQLPERQAQGMVGHYWLVCGYLSTFG